MREPLVSVLIPAHNAGGTIAETIASALKQSYRHLEVIVVDDASGDETAAIVERAASEDIRVTLIKHDRNLGVAVARNRGLQAARGEFVAPLDADDLWHPDKIARQMRRRSEVGDAGVVYCWSADIDRTGHVIERRLDLDRYEGDVYAPLVVTNFLGNASVPLIRRDLILAIGGWDTSLRERGAQGCEDWQLYLRLAERTAFALEPTFLVGYRQAPNAMSRNIGQMRRSYRLVLDEAMRTHRELPASLFRWSRSAFDQYAAETLMASGGTFSGAMLYLRAVAADPTWLRRRSTRKRVRRFLGGLKRGATGEQVTPRVPLHFTAIAPEPERELREGRAIASRRLRLGAIRILSEQR